MKKNKINLGCGKGIKKNFLNIDFEKFEGVDLIFDLNKIPYPFKKNEIEEVLMHNVLEHLNEPYQIMKEIFRICKTNARISIKVPHFSSNTVWGDIQHKRGYSIETFRNKNLTCMFKVIENKIIFSRHYKLIESIVNKFPRIYEKIFSYIFPAAYLKIVLVKR